MCGSLKIIIIIIIIVDKVKCFQWGRNWFISFFVFCFGPSPDLVLRKQPIKSEELTENADSLSLLCCVGMCVAVFFFYFLVATQGLTEHLGQVPVASNKSISCRQTQQSRHPNSWLALIKLASEFIPGYVFVFAH